MAGFGPEGSGEMSYILDALKKLEHEKSRKSRGDGMINITGALFENERPKSSGTAGWKIALAVMVAVLVTFAATRQFFQPGKGLGNSSPRHATPAPQTPPVKIETAPVPSVPPVVQVQETPPVVPPVPASPAQVTAVIPSVKSTKPQKVVVQAVATTATATASEDSATGLTIQELRKRQKEQKSQELPTEQTIAAPADIKLSGIAWQEERRARRAVVNGFLVHEGGVVSGAKITDIFQDRVRFSQSGKSFEIPLISSGAPAAGK
jgi:general secretion pathway protein B